MERFEFMKDDMTDCFCDIEPDLTGSLVNYDDAMAEIERKDEVIHQLQEALQNLKIMKDKEIAALEGMEHDEVVLDAIKRANKLGAKVVECRWLEDENSVWWTDCGNGYDIMEGTPYENMMRFCLYCGKPLKQVEYEEAGI